MDFIYTQAHFFMRFEIVRVGVILSSATVSDDNYKLNASEIEPRTEIECRAPRIGFIRTQGHFFMHFEAVCVGVNLSATCPGR